MSIQKILCVSIFLSCFNSTKSLGCGALSSANEKKTEFLKLQKSSTQASSQEDLKWKQVQERMKVKEIQRKKAIQ